MTEELYKLKKDDSLSKKSEELYKKENEIIDIKEFLKKFKDILTSKESIKAIKNLESYIKIENEIDTEIRKLKLESLEKKRKINSLCNHDIVINDNCFICSSMCDDSTNYGIKISNVKNYYQVYNVIKKLFDENNDYNTFMKQVFEYAKEVQYDYNVKMKRRY